MEILASWENPRPLKQRREHEPPLRRLFVELTLVVESNEDPHEILRAMERNLVGVEATEHHVARSRMPRWLRRIDVDGIFEDEDE